MPFMIRINFGGNVIRMQPSRHASPCSLPAMGMQHLQPVMRPMFDAVPTEHGTSLVYDTLGWSVTHVLQPRTGRCEIDA